MDLHLFNNRPWDSLTTAELRTIARIFVEASRSDHYSIENVFIQIFLERNDLEVLCGNSERTDEGMEPYYYLRRKASGPWWRRRKAGEPFRLYVSALQYWLKPKKEGGGGCFDFILDGSRRTKSPEVPRQQRLLRTLWTRLTRPHFSTPARYCSDWTWQHYRTVCDYYDQYVRVSNARARHLRSLAAAPSSIDFDAMLDAAQAQFLAAIFCRRTWYRDDRGIFRFAHRYRPGQATANARFFRCIDPVDMQLILFWWEGMLHHLGTQYSKCFRKGKSAPDKSDPLSIYSRSMATLEKYTGSDETVINEKTYTLVLQQLADMVAENEAYERAKQHK